MGGCGVSKWLCAQCKAVNPDLGFQCHNCGHTNKYTEDAQQKRIEQLEGENEILRSKEPQFKSTLEATIAEKNKLEGEVARYKAKFTNQVDYAISLEHTIREIETDLATIRNYETSSLGKANKLVHKLQQANQVLRDGLEIALNYLHWREDDLIGDDLIGDNRLTQAYKDRINTINKALEQADKIMEGEK
jgi:hypothetical protein